MQPLSPREREVFALVAQGFSNREIGAQLGISARTVEAHRLRMIEKTGARNTVDMVRRVLENGRAEQA